MRIGVDIDEVLFPFIIHFLDFYRGNTGIDIPFEEIHTYYLWEVFGCEREEIIAKINEFYSSSSFKRIKPIEGAVKSIDSLSKKHSLTAITARPVLIDKETSRWMNSYFPAIEEIVYTSSYHDNARGRKVQECLARDISTILEDVDDYALECAEQGIKVILFDKPWNKNTSHSLIKRVYNWPDALKQIDSIANRI